MEPNDCMFYVSVDLDEAYPDDSLGGREALNRSLFLTQHGFNVQVLTEDGYIRVVCKKEFLFSDGKQAGILAAGLANLSIPCSLRHEGALDEELVIRGFSGTIGDVNG